RGPRPARRRGRRGRGRGAERGGPGGPLRLRIRRRGNPLQRGARGLMPQPPNMANMMKQVQKMQADMLAAQEQLKHETVEASAGGGMVTVKMTGDLELRELRIDPDAIDPEDAEML